MSTQARTSGPGSSGWAGRVRKSQCTRPSDGLQVHAAEVGLATHARPPRERQLDLEAGTVSLVRDRPHGRPVDAVPALERISGLEATA